MYDSPDNFGKDLGLFHEILVEGRKLSLSREWWKQFLDKKKLCDVVEFLSAREVFQVPILQAESFQCLLDKFPGRADTAINPQDMKSAWWRSDISLPATTLPMCLFQKEGLKSEEEGRAALHKWGLRPAGTQELISFSHFLYYALAPLSGSSRVTAVEEGVRNHVVALNARRIDRQEQDRVLGAEVNRNLNSSWFLRSYCPDKNRFFWERDKGNVVYLVGVVE